MRTKRKKKKQAGHHQTNKLSLSPKKQHRKRKRKLTVNAATTLPRRFVQMPKLAYSVAEPQGPEDTAGYSLSPTKSHSPIPLTTLALSLLSFSLFCVRSLPLSSSLCLCVCTSQGLLILFCDSPVLCFDFSRSRFSAL